MSSLSSAVRLLSRLPGTLARRLDAKPRPSIFSRSLASNVDEFPLGIEPPLADARTARLLVNLGTSATNHVVVEAFHELPEQVQAKADANTP